MLQPSTSELMNWGVVCGRKKNSLLFDSAPVCHGAAAHLGHTGWDLTKILHMHKADKIGQVPQPQGFVLGCNHLQNVVLEHAMRKWKLKLTNEGFRLGQDTRLTNVRYADDRMIFATSREKLLFMVERLAQQPSLVGLQLNGTKTKRLTTPPSQEASHFKRRTNIRAASSLAE